MNQRIASATLLALLFSLLPSEVQAQACQPEWTQPTGPGSSADSFIRAVTTFDDGTGTALYVAGFFLNAGGVPANRIAKWDGATWSPLGQGIGGGAVVLDLLVFDDGSGPALYVGGDFQTAGGAPASNIARWDGTSWSPVGAGLSGVLATEVDVLGIADLGNGPRLFAGGRFTASGAATLSNVAMWDGTAWSAVGTGVANGTDGPVYALAEFDDGTGNALYVGGDFGVNGFPITPFIRDVARWDGNAWSSLGQGLNSVTTVRAMTVFDIGQGPVLFVGGDATSSAPTYLESWDGASWSPIGASISGSNIRDLVVHDAGNGPRLFAAHSPSNVSEFDGQVWNVVGTGVSPGFITDLASGDLGAGQALYGIGSTPSPMGQINLLAQWFCADTGIEFCNGDGGDGLGCTNCPCGNNAPPGTLGGCLNSAAQSCALLANGLPSVQADTMRFDITGATPSSFGLLLSANQQLPAAGSCPPGSGILSVGAPMDGLRCIGGGLIRHGARSINSAGENATPWGEGGTPANGLIASGGFLAGQTRQWQVFYREGPGMVCNTGLNSSNAVSVSFLP